MTAPELMPMPEYDNQAPKPKRKGRQALLIIGIALLVVGLVVSMTGIWQLFAPGAAVPPQLRAQIRALEEDQKRRATRSLRDGIDRILTDLLSLYRDAALEALGAGLELVNREQAARIAELAEGWGAERVLGAVAAVEQARDRLSRGVTPGLVLEAMFAGTVMAGAAAAGTAGADGTARTVARAGR